MRDYNLTPRLVASRSMGRDRDANHEVSGRDGDRDADFTQPTVDPAIEGEKMIHLISSGRRRAST